MRKSKTIIDVWQNQKTETSKKHRTEWVTKESKVKMILVFIALVLALPVINVFVPTLIAVRNGLVFFVLSYFMKKMHIYSMSFSKLLVRKHNF